MRNSNMNSDPAAANFSKENLLSDEKIDKTILLIEWKTEAREICKETKRLVKSKKAKN